MPRITAEEIDIAYGWANNASDISLDDLDFTFGSFDDDDNSTTQFEQDTAVQGEDTTEEFNTVNSADEDDFGLVEPNYSDASDELDEDSDIENEVEEELDDFSDDFGGDFEETEDFVEDTSAEDTQTDFDDGGFESLANATVEEVAQAPVSEVVSSISDDDGFEDNSTAEVAEDDATKIEDDASDEEDYGEEDFGDDFGGEDFAEGDDFGGDDFGGDDFAEDDDASDVEADAIEDDGEPFTDDEEDYGEMSGDDFGSEDEADSENDVTLEDIGDDFGDDDFSTSEVAQAPVVEQRPAEIEQKPAIDFDDDSFGPSVQSPVEQKSSSTQNVYGADTHETHTPVNISVQSGSSDIELERQKLEIERQRLELERQKMELEREKMQIQATKSNAQNNQSKPVTKSGTTDGKKVVDSNKKSTATMNSSKKPAQTQTAKDKMDFNSMSDEKLWRYMSYYMDKCGVAKHPIKKEVLVAQFGEKSVVRMVKQGYIVATREGGFICQ